MYQKLSIVSIVTVIVYIFLSFLNFTAHAADCDSRVYLNEAKPTDSGSRQYDGFLLYTGKSPGTAETVGVTDKNGENQIRRYIVERILIGTTPTTLTHGLKDISARAYPDTLDIDPTKRESQHVVARCAPSSGQYICNAFPDPMSMVKIRTYYSQNEPGKIEFTLNAPRPEIRKAFKINPQKCNFRTEKLFVSRSVLQAVSSQPPSRKNQSMIFFKQLQTRLL